MNNWGWYLIIAICAWILFPIWVHVVVRAASFAWAIGRYGAYISIEKEIQKNGKKQNNP